MQETTFNSAYQADGSILFSETRSWLIAHNESASLQKLDQSDLYHLISHTLSFENLEKKLNYTFLDKKNLIQALMQSTYCHERKDGPLISNERLEFLGDSLLNLIVGKNLYHCFVSSKEGDLSKLRGALVNEEKLASLARVINLGDFIFMGKGELKTNGADKDSILADTFEALFAAIYIDSSEAMKVVEEIFSSVVDLYEKQYSSEFYSLDLINDFDPKSKLQELMMAKHGSFPVYKSHELPDGSGFLVELWHNDKKLAEMSGPSKKKVEKKISKKNYRRKTLLDKPKVSKKERRRECY